MSNNAPDYDDNLAFPPHTILTPGGVIRVEGDWSNTQPKNNTDRTTSTIELVDKIEKLSKQLEITVKGLKDVIETAKTGFVVCDACGFQGECRDCAAQIVAEQALDELQALEK